MLNGEAESGVLLEAGASAGLSDTVVSLSKSRFRASAWGRSWYCSPERVRQSDARSKPTKTCLRHREGPPPVKGLDDPKPPGGILN